MLDFSNNGEMVLTQAIDPLGAITGVVKVTIQAAQLPYRDRVYLGGGQQYATLIDHSDKSRKPEIILLDTYDGFSGGEHAYTATRPNVHENMAGWPVGTRMELRVTAEMLASFVQHVEPGALNTHVMLGRGKAAAFQANGFPALTGQGASEQTLDYATSYECLAASHCVNLGDTADTWAANQEYESLSVLLAPSGLEQWTFMGAGDEALAKNATAPLGEFDDELPAYNDDDPLTHIGRWVKTPIPVAFNKNLPAAGGRVLFFVTEVGFICASRGAGAVPSVSIGTAGDPTRFVNSQALSEITASGSVHRFPIAAGGVGVQNLTFEQTGATTGDFIGRFYWKGFYIGGL
jgi:hypothetical protein